MISRHQVRRGTGVLAAVLMTYGCTSGVVYVLEEPRSEPMQWNARSVAFAGALGVAGDTALASGLAGGHALADGKRSFGDVFPYYAAVIATIDVLVLLYQASSHD